MAGLPLIGFSDSQVGDGWTMSSGRAEDLAAFSKIQARLARSVGVEPSS